MPGHIPHSAGSELLDLPATDNAAAILTAVALKEHEEMLRKEVESTRTQAREQGYREGYSAGLESAEAEFREKLDSFRSVIETAQSAMQQTISGSEDAVVEIAFEATRKMLGTAMADRAGITASVKQVIAQAKERERLIIRVSPSDFVVLSEKQLFAGAGLSNCELLPDERVVLGGCLLEASGGNLDGRLETQFQQFREILLAAKAKQSGGEAE